MVYALVVAAGSGTRMRAMGNKLFLPLAGKPLICRSWEALDSSEIVDRIIIVTKAELFEDFQELNTRYSYKTHLELVVGGAERQDSVWNGLQFIGSENAEDVVLIHDGARPFLSNAFIELMVRSARLHGAAVAASPVIDTIKSSQNGEVIHQHLDRSKLWAVQTPQAFRSGIIKKAIQAARDQGLTLTDDTAACDLIQQPVHLTPWTEPNPKITLPSDLPYFEYLASRSATS